MYNLLETKAAEYLYNLRKGKNVLYKHKKVN